MQASTQRLPIHTAGIFKLALCFVIWFAAARCPRSLADGADKPPADAAVATSQSPVVEALLADGGKLNMTVRNQTLELVTPYGKLTIPVDHILRIEFGFRLSLDERRRIAAAIADLGHADFDKRENATNLLTAMDAKAAEALEAAANSDDSETARRAKQIIETLHEHASPRQLAARRFDIVHTQMSAIAGHISEATIKVHTQQFGELELKLADVREWRSPSLGSPEQKDVLPDPGTLGNMQKLIGKTLAFRVTGAATGGSIWGTDLYTLDSKLALAAVHAGVVKPGQTKVVQVIIVGPTTGFIGSTRNGVSSSGYSSYPAAYRFISPTR